MPTPRIVTIDVVKYRKTMILEERHLWSHLLVRLENTLTANKRWRRQSIEVHRDFSVLQTIKSE